MIQLLKILLFAAVLVYLQIVIVFYYKDIRNLKILNCKSILRTLPPYVS
jgi:hypothetical protein